MLIMRRRAPEMARRFRTPLPWVTGIAGIVGCLYLLFSLPQRTQFFFLLWNALGLGVYVVRSMWADRPGGRLSA